MKKSTTWWQFGSTLVSVPKATCSLFDVAWPIRPGRTHVLFLLSTTTTTLLAFIDWT